MASSSADGDAVVFFDDNDAKRAPFFHLLWRLDLVRLVDSLVGDSLGESGLGLSQVAFTDYRSSTLQQEALLYRFFVSRKCSFGRVQLG